MFLPVNKNEAKKRGFEQFDVILISGDAYIDSAYFGIAVIGRILESKGYRVGIIAQPALDSGNDISRLGEPRLFWGVSAGSVDSMVANYTALNLPRKNDDYTPGGVNNRRPDRASIAYTNLIRKYFKNTVPIVLGGIEASLRRIAHYDYKTDIIRRSILIDSKADYIVYGEGERTVLNIADYIDRKQNIDNLNGLCRVSTKPDTLPQNYLALPSYEVVSADKDAFIEMFDIFYRNNTPGQSNGLIQKHGGKYLVQNPPEQYLKGPELDDIHALPFQNNAHPDELRRGKIKALDTVKHSITTHRGCFGECNFCAIAVHQGRIIRSRSEQSIYDEAVSISRQKDFKGYIFDLGGPTANMYGTTCKMQATGNVCKNKRCLFPENCPEIRFGHEKQIALLKKIREISGVKKVFVASGIRPDLISADKQNGKRYIKAVADNHVSGQLKLAPEHTDRHVLNCMGKTSIESVSEFKRHFDYYSAKAGKNQFLTYYFIAAHPGTEEKDMLKMKKDVGRELRISPEQVQIFTPTPGTWAGVMYHTEKDPFTGERLFVEKGTAGKKKQKSAITSEKNKSKRDFKTKKTADKRRERRR